MSSDPYKRYINTKFTESNGSNYQANNYDNVYKPQYNQALSTEQEPQIEYESTECYLTVSSRDRDVEEYPSVSNYTLRLPTEFRNVSSIELIQAIIPDKNSVTQEPYLLLNIKELEEVMFSVDRNISDAFAILQMGKPITDGGFIQIDKRIHENVVKHYKTPKSSLSKMTISITDLDGNIFDFGDSGSTNKQYINTFVFRIVCLEKKRSVLNHRNIF